MDDDTTRFSIEPFEWVTSQLHNKSWDALTGILIPMSDAQTYQITAAAATSATISVTIKHQKGPTWKNASP